MESEDYALTYAVNGSADIYLNSSYNSSQMPSMDEVNTYDDQASYIVKDIVIPIVFGFGIIGNIISIGVFGHHIKNGNAGVLEKSTMIGLVTLAISDLLFCMVGFPAIILGNTSLQSYDYGVRVAAFYYDIYQVPLLNIFLFSSTWLITIISAERCLAICHPHFARDCITVPRTVAVHSLVFVISLCFNMPLFFTFDIYQYPCANTSSCYIKMPGWFFHQQTNIGVHFIFWSIFGTFLPLVLLLIGNTRILRKVLTRKQTKKFTKNYMMRLTWILITMVFCFIILVCPSIILQFMYRIGYATNIKHYTVAIMVTNLLQAVKFSGNFLLYCTLHQRFRSTITGSIISRSSRGSYSSSRHSHDK